MSEDVQALIMESTRFRLLHELRGARTPKILSENLRIPYKRVEYHLKKLVDGGLVDKLPRPKGIRNHGSMSRIQVYRLSKMGRGECESLGVFS